MGHPLMFLMSMAGAGAMVLFWVMISPKVKEKLEKLEDRIEKLESK